MTIGWITIAAIAAGICWLVTFTLLKMADDNDRAARAKAVPRSPAGTRILALPHLLD